MEGQAGEGRYVGVCQLLIGVLPILTLYGPELAFVGLCDQVDAFVGGRQVKPLTRNGRNLVEVPDMLELGRVFGCKLEIGLCQVFEPIAFLFLRLGGPCGMDVGPAIGGRHCGKKSLRPRSHGV